MSNEGRLDLVELELLMSGFRPPELIETERLYMRPLVDSDANELFNVLFGDPATTLDLSWRTHHHIDESRNSILRLAEGWRNGTYFSWGLFEKKSGQLIGMLEMHGRLPRVEIGLITSLVPGRLRTRAWSEMLHKFLDWLIEQPNVCRIEAFCSVTGKAAPLMSRMGFVCEGILRNYEARPNRGMSAGDSYLFAITKPPRAIDTTASASQPRAQQDRDRVATSEISMAVLRHLDQGNHRL